MRAPMRPELVGLRGAADRDDDRNAAHNTHKRRRNLGLLEIAALFAPAGAVPALIRHQGRILVHHCPADIAWTLPTEGEA